MTGTDTSSRMDADGPKAELVESVRDAIGDDLRDVWVIDERTQEPLYLRDDVADRVEDIDVEKYLDNERYGFVTRETYNLLHYSEFRYTHRGFDSWDLFRTFVVADGEKVGVLVSLDADGTNYDFAALADVVHDTVGEHGVGAFRPVADGG